MPSDKKKSRSSKIDDGFTFDIDNKDTIPSEGKPRNSSPYLLFYYP